MTRDGLELMRLLVHTFNAAVDALPELPLVRHPSWAPCSAAAAHPPPPPPAQGFTDRAAAEAAALPSREAQVLADEVQRQVAAKEEAKKAKQAAGRR